MFGVKHLVSRDMQKLLRVKISESKFDRSHLSAIRNDEYTKVFIKCMEIYNNFQDFNFLNFEISARFQISKSWDFNREAVEDFKVVADPSSKVEGAPQPSQNAGTFNKGLR